MIIPSPQQLYDQRIADGALKADPQQAQVVEALQRLYQNILSVKPQSRWPFARKRSCTLHENGIYLYGGVGRGKSMLMDLFFASLPASIPKQRVHFHAFMLGLHDWLHKARTQRKGSAPDDLLLEFASHLSKQTRILCFDEFHVTDVADAMLLGRLFSALWDRGVITIATSNWPPAQLYKDGLQRELFLPFIATLQQRLQVIALESDTDYRLNRLRGMPVYYAPLGPATRDRLQHAWDDLTGHAVPEPYALPLAGREWLIARTANGVAWLDFADACGQARGAADYLALAMHFRVIIVDQIPLLTENLRNEAKRFITLIDALYEARTKCIFGAESVPEKLFSTTSHAFEFTRTISRLQEMQSKTYIVEINLEIEILSK